MTPFDNIVGQTIISVLRQDYERNYEFQSPLGIYLLTSEQDGLYLGILNDGTSVNVERMNTEQLNEYCGTEYLESHLNELHVDDELNSIIGEQISTIELAEYKTEEIEGNNFIVKQGKYAGIRILTTSNELTFYNSDGCTLWMNLDMEIPNENRCNWIKNEPQQNV
ncbi:MAG: hypothetical protein ACI923_002576 [Flavobacteriales bacterium]|jgi:hypothetical protein